MTTKDYKNNYKTTKNDYKNDYKRLQKKITKKDYKRLQKRLVSISTDWYTWLRVKYCCSPELAGGKGSEIVKLIDSVIITCNIHQFCQYFQHMTRN